MAPVLCSNSSEINIGQVEDIQELWRSRPATVPERYVRDRDERPVSPHSPFVELEVPVIDMSKLIWGNPCEVRTEMAKHTAACQEWGFFQVVNHGVDHGLLERIEEVAMDFFMLPLQEKEKYPMVPGTLQGGHTFIFSEDQKLDWCNRLALGVEPPFIRNHKLWPTNPSNFSETLETYSSSIRILCQRLLALIAKKPWTETNCVQRYVRGGSSGSEDELLPTLLQARSRIGIESTFGWQRADCLATRLTINRPANFQRQHLVAS